MDHTPRNEQQVREYRRVSAIGPRLVTRRPMVQLTPRGFSMIYKHRRRFLARIATLVLSVVVLFAALPRGLVAQSACRASGGETEARIVALKEMMTSSDSRWIATRRAYSLPVVADSAIVGVVDSATCSRAASAYNNALPVVARVSGRRVYVVRVGPTRLIVWDDPSVDGLADEYEVLMVMDTSFTILGSFAT